MFLLGKSYGQRSLAGHSPQGHKESDMTKLLSMRSCARTHTHTHTHTQLWEEDHMVPLQCGGNLWPRVGAGVGLEVERGTKKPKLATLGYRRSRNYSGKSFSFLLLVQRLSTFPSPLSLIFSCKISCISLSFSPHFLLPVFQFRLHSLALCS